jgi:hypothetical protein
MKSRRHVVPYKGKWAVRKAGSKRVSSTHETQREAEQSAKKGARRDGGEVVIHRPNGRIRDSDSFGNDPCPPKDSKH